MRPAITQGGVALVPSEADAGHVDSGNDPILLFVIQLTRRDRTSATPCDACGRLLHYSQECHASGAVARATATPSLPENRHFHPDLATRVIAFQKAASKRRR